MNEIPKKPDITERKRIDEGSRQLPVYENPPQPPVKKEDIPKVVPKKDS